MKKILPVLLLFFGVILNFSATAQRQAGETRPERKITGTVIDGATKTPMIGANVLIKTVTDSLLLGTVTDVDGKFELARPRIPSVVIEIKFIGYQSIIRTHEMRDPVELGELILLEDTKLLGEVVVKGLSPVGEMRGDTTSFNASAFKTQENAQAEDLIRKMPGITVQNGQVQAQGEQVQKILVDGREFFGSDPNIALRNLPADAIDRVEVLDQRSDQSRLTGFDDGNYTKTINIILKENNKNGQFGRAYAGYGTDERYSAGGSINLFKGDQKISILGLFNNINQQNFSSQDLAGVSANASGGGGGRRPGGGRNQFGGGGNNNFFVGGSNGITGTNAFGLNYSDKWGKKVNFTGSYFFNNTSNTLRQITNRETVINESFSQIYEESLTSRADNSNHRINARIEADLNAKNSIIITPNISFQTNDSFSDRDAFTRASNGDSLSALRSISDAETKSFNIANNITYRYKFDKKGRTLSTDIFTALTKRDQFSDLLAASVDYRRQQLDTAIQETTALSDGFNYRVNLTWTEPLGEKSIGTFGYQAANNKTSSDQKVAVLTETPGLFRLDTALSNEFDNKFLTQRLRSGYAYNKAGLNLNFNLDYQNSRLDNEAFFPKSGVFVRDFNNILPSANISYRDTKKGISYRFRYRTDTDEPSVRELQNVVNNSNPLNLSVGNPNLGQSFNHNIFANVSKVNLEKSRTLFLFLNYSGTSDFIGNNTFITSKDTLINNEILLRPGGQISQPINLDGNFRTTFFLTYGAPIKGLKTNFNVNSRVNFNRIPGIINGEKNLNDNLGLSQGLTLTSNVSKNLDFTISSTGTYNIVNSSLQTAQNNNFYSQESNLRLYFSPNGGKLFLGNNLNHTLYTGLTEGFNQNFWLWNIEGGFRFAKNNKAELKLVVFDLLNENNSISRTISDVSVTDVFTNVLTRYTMLTFTYIIGNFKQPEPSQNQPWQKMRPAGGRTW